MKGDDEEDLHSISSRLGHDAAALTRKIGLWSSWSADELAAGEDIRPLLAKIAANADQLAVLIKSASRLGTIETAKLDLQDMSLSQSVSIALRMAQLERQDISVIVNGDSDVKADPVLVGLALSALFENVALHGDKGRCDIKISDHQLTVANSAPRAPDPEDFTPFVSGLDGQPGIGLTLVRRAMMRIRGTVSTLSTSDDTYAVQLTFEKAEPIP